MNDILSRRALLRGTAGLLVWRYGVAENARDIETLARYSFEQGLATRKLSAEEIFHPSVFEISKV